MTPRRCGGSAIVSSPASPRPERRERDASEALEIGRERLDSAVATRLIAALNAELTARYPEDDATHFRLDADEVAEGRGAFLVVRLRGEPVGCGAIRKIDPATAEIKRMY